MKFDSRMWKAKVDYLNNFLQDIWCFSGILIAECVSHVCESTLITHTHQLKEKKEKKKEKKFSERQQDR